MAQHVDAPIRKDDLPRPDLQTQINDLRSALEEWRRTREYSQATEERLAQLTVQCARMVESWQQIEERRKAAAAGREERRGDFGAREDRLQQETRERLRALERAIEHEWDTLRDSPDEPSTQLRQRDASLSESSIATNLTLRGFENMESRLAALELDLQGRIAQLSRDLQSVIAELRSARPQPAPGAAQAFPLEGVMRIHEELRESGAKTGSGADALKGGPARALPQWAESATALTARLESLERKVGTAAVTPQPAGGWRPQYWVIGLLAALTVATGVFTLSLQRRVDTRLSDAAVRVSAAEAQRDATIAAAREEATRQVADARQSASQAQIVGNVLAAPDRVRYWLGGVGANTRAYAQVLFSRSRGVVFSASRLQPPGEGKAYQLWLLTRTGPVSAGVVTPDASGRVNLVTDVPPAVLKRRLAGALVTLEPAAGASQPSRQRVLIRTE